MARTPVPRPADPLDAGKEAAAGDPIALDTAVTLITETCARYAS